MEIKNIVCPVDFSDSSDKALLMAGNLASQFQAMLYIVHVEEVARQDALSAGNEFNEHKRLLEMNAPMCEDKIVQHHYLRGKVADEVILFAQAREADLIVMGTHGRSGLAKLLMGSVADSVVRNAHCMVLSVRTCSESATHTDAA